MLEPVFHETKAALRANNRFVSDELLAVALLLLAKLDATPSDVSLARALSIAEYSEIRFSGLIRCDDASELFTHLQRAVRFCGNRVNPFKLTQTVFGWTENRVAVTRKRMIADFYSFADQPAA
jgi:CRISPR type I-E-associated protein CasB/Cse2